MTAQNGSAFRNVVVLTAVLAVVAVWMWSTQDALGALSDRAGESVMPDLVDSLNDVGLVTVERGGETYTLERQGGEWVVRDWGGFPARFEDVKEFVYGLSQLTLHEPKTARPDRWNQLGVEEPGPGSEATRVRLTAEGAAVGDVVLGRRAAQDALYVRRSGEDRSWRTKGFVEPPRAAVNFVERDIVSIPGTRIARVSIEHPDGEAFALKRTGETSTSWVLEELPPGQELISPGLLSSLAGTLARFDLDGVVPPGDVDATNPEWTTARFEAKDGLVVTLRTTPSGEDTLARIQVAFVPPPAEPAGPPAEGEAPAADDGPSPEEVASEAATLQAKVGRWTYVIPKYRAEQLRKRLADLVQDLPPAAPADGEPVENILDLMGGQDGGG